MPPVPKAKKTAPRDKTSTLLGELGIEDEPVGSGRNEAPDSPASAPLPTGGAKTPSERKLQEKVQRLYMVLGTVLRPFGRFIPQLEPISDNLKTFADDAAEAWIDLARDDPKVKKYLESITSASSWGNVVGIHFAIFASAIPTGITQSPAASGNDPLDMLRAMGASEEDIAMAMAMAGVSGDTVRTGGPPEPPIEDIQRTEKPAGEPNGIVTPEELGVQIPGSEYDDPMMTGGIK